MVSFTLIRYAIIRTIMLISMIIVAYSICFILIKFMPYDAVEFIISQYITSPSAQYQDPIVIETLRESLYELFGLRGSLFDQYIIFLKRFFIMDFGPSILSFPTPAINLILIALPWTIGLLSVTTLISWIVGNILGVFVGHLRLKGTASKIMMSVAIVLRPMPYYIMALILIFLFVYWLKIFPLPGTGGALYHEYTLEWFIGIVYRLTLPALSLIIINSFGWWFLSSFFLTLNVMAEDYYYYAELRGLSKRRILTKYVFRSVLLPQITSLGLALGGIFGGALLTESIFALPGLGGLLYRAISAGDIMTALGILSLSILAVAIATYILDLIYPLIDPRVRYR